MFTFEQIIGDLKKKIYKPIYFLMGDEGYYIDEITQYIEKNILPPDEQSFNQTVVYGRDIDMVTLLNNARQFPMMSNYNVVIVKEGQDLKGLDGSSEPFLKYAENPPQSTIMVVNFRNKSLDKRKKLYKVLDKTACLFESKKLYDNKVGAWITNFVKSKGYSIDVPAAELMASHIGSDLSKVVNEVNKLLLVEAPGSNISLKEIEENIGISKDFNVFELQKALGARNLNQALLIVTHMAKNPKTKSIIPLVTLLYSFFAKLLLLHSSADKSQQGIASAIGVNPYFVRDYLEAGRNYNKAKCAHVISILREFDTKSKGIDSPPIDDAELMKEMTYKIVMV